MVNFVVGLSLQGSEMKTATVVSSGGIIFRCSRKGKIEVALVARENKQVWCLPKGLVEKGESLEVAALREAREETGLSGKVVAPLGQIDYWFYWKEDQTRYHKFVHFFLMRYASGRLEDHDFEMEEARWVPIGEAIKMLSYKNEVEMMKRAWEFLRKSK